MPFTPANYSRPPGAGRIAARLVLDTNVWLDWLVFGDPLAAPIRAAVFTGRAVIFIDDACAAELARVLAYPLGRRSLDAAGQAAAIAECGRFAQRIERESLKEGPISALPRCRDPDDQKFLEAAAAARADMLLTKDAALLELGRRRAKPPFRILTPQAFAEAQSSDGW
jgi:putative PIN family toxin of toxin-antitoxin system